MPGAPLCLWDESPLRPSFSACEVSEGPSGYRRGSGYCSWRYWRAWLPGLLFLTWGPWVAGASPERKGGNDIGTLTEGLPEVCIWLRGNLLVPQLSCHAPAQPLPRWPLSGPDFKS